MGLGSTLPKWPIMPIARTIEVVTFLLLIVFPVFGQDRAGIQKKSITHVYASTIANDIGNRKLTSIENARQKRAKQLVESGPIELASLLRIGLEYNNEIQAARAQLRSVCGDKWITYSRFLPHVSFDIQYSRSDSGMVGDTEQTTRSISISDTLFEFGRDNDRDKVLRDSERKALYGLENTIRNALFGIRTQFYSIVLRQQQISERDSLLRDYRDRYEKLKELEQMRRVLEVDLLTSRLNVLHEEARKNELQQDVLRRKMELMAHLGLPVGLTGFALSGEIEVLNLNLDSCVTMALNRSTAIAQAAALLKEQKRNAIDAYWSHAPQIALRSGWADSSTTAGVSVNQNQGTYAVAAFGEKSLDQTQDQDEGWFVDLSLKIPILQGLSSYGLHKKEHGLYDKALRQLRATADTVEINTRKAYYAVQEQRQQLEILKETATISKERLQIQERLKEIGKISDNELETFRNQFFADQNAYYDKEIALVVAQEALRSAICWFDPSNSKPALPQTNKE